MAKRAKATKTAGARPKATQAEPFFRPFSKLNAAKSRKIADKKAAESSAAAAKEKPAPKAAPSASRRTAPAPSPPGPTDAHAFALYMAGVRALPEDRAHRIPANASKVERAARGAGAARAAGHPTPVPVDDADADARSRMRSLVNEGLRFETVDDGERLEGRRLDVDPRELRRLRRGQYAIDGRIDLHGLSADEARHAVEEFVKNARATGTGWSSSSMGRATTRRAGTRSSAARSPRG